LLPALAPDFVPELRWSSNFHVGNLAIHIDGYPVAFRKDVLSSGTWLQYAIAGSFALSLLFSLAGLPNLADAAVPEAHRNVLIERIGFLCLLKLRCGDDFASRAGSAWRLLYCLSLMPWLRRYREAISFDTRVLEGVNSDDDSSTGSQPLPKKPQLKLESGMGLGVVSSQTAASEIEHLKSKLLLLEKENKRLTMTVAMVMSAPREDVDSDGRGTDADITPADMPSSEETRINL
jgi:hypothetical protein